MPSSTRLTGTVLVIDDDDRVTQTFARMLRLEGCQVFTAANAEDGLCQVDRSHPDVILLDLRMPSVDGLGFLQRLRSHEDQRKTSVAIVTGDYFLGESIEA